MNDAIGQLDQLETDQLLNIELEPLLTRFNPPPLFLNLHQKTIEYDRDTVCHRHRCGHLETARSPDAYQAVPFARP